MSGKLKSLDSKKRQDIVEFKLSDISITRQSELLGVARSGLYYLPKINEEAGAPKEQRKPVVKLALGDAFELSREYTDLRRILETAPTKFGDVTADLVPKELWTKNEHAINQAMQEEVNRIAGKTVEPILASDIRYEGIDGIRGVYHQASGLS